DQVHEGRSGRRGEGHDDVVVVLDLDDDGELSGCSRILRRLGPCVPFGTARDGWPRVRLGAQRVPPSRRQRAPEHPGETERTAAGPGGLTPLAYGTSAARGRGGGDIGHHCDDRLKPLCGWAALRGRARARAPRALAPPAPWTPAPWTPAPWTLVPWALAPAPPSRTLSPRSRPLRPHRHDPCLDVWADERAPRPP